MNCLCLNVRGCGDSHKIDWIHRLKISQKVDFIGLQETWVADSNNIDFKGLWGNEDYEVAFVNPVGKSGGIVNGMEYQELQPLSMCMDHNLLHIKEDYGRNC